MERLRRAGIPLLIVSKETNPVVRARAAKLGAEVLHGIEHKTEVVRDWLDGAASRRPVPPISATTSTIWGRWIWSAGRSP